MVASPAALSQYPRIASPGEAVACYAGADGYGHQWPPPGTTSTTTAHPELWPLIRGRGSGPAGFKWWGTVAEVQAEQYLGDASLSWVSDLARALAPIRAVVPAIDVIGSIPVIFTVGGSQVRWIRTTLRGTLADQEIFQHKLDWGMPDNDPTYSDNQLQNIAGNVANAWAIHLLGTGASTGQFLASDVKYTEVAACNMVFDNALVGADKLTAEPAQYFNWPTGAQPGGTGGTSLPYEVAVCVSLHTDRRGARGRGRFYLPPMSTQLMAAKGRFSSGMGANVATNLVSFYELLAANNPDVMPVVVSAAGGELNPITSVSVGDVPDAQRRRRNAQAENRSVVGLIGA